MATWIQYITSILENTTSLAILGYIGVKATDHFKMRSNDKLKHTHEISQNTYAEFFSKKMKAYIDLASLKQAYIIAVDEYVPDPLLDMENINYKSVDLMLDMRKSIQSNNIYLSSSLVDCFDDWNKKFISIKNGNEYDSRERWSYFQQMEEATGEHAGLLADQEKYLAFEKFMRDERVLWEKLLTNIDMDVAKLRKKYNL